MDRWKRIERLVLLASCSGLFALSVWLFFHESGVRLLLALASLPFAFWALWQALYEDKLSSNEPPTTGERIAYYAWLVARRMVVGSVAIVFGWAAFALASRAGSPADFVGAGVFALLALLAGWIALFGGGVAYSMSDDARVYRLRRARYGSSPKSEA
jgi:hypothetical protein